MRSLVTLFFACIVFASSSVAFVTADEGQLIMAWETPPEEVLYAQVRRISSRGHVEVTSSRLRTHPAFRLAVGPCAVVVQGERKQPPQGLLIPAVIEEVSLQSLRLMVSSEAVAQLAVGDQVALLRPPAKHNDEWRRLPASLPLRPPADEAPALQQKNLVASQNNLKQIVQALHHYHHANRAFPPAVVYGADGKPWHSWRVLLLPYLNQSGLYNQYNFDEPWDSENNRKLLARKPRVYHNPLYGDKLTPDTHYAAIVGANTVLARDETGRRREAAGWRGKRIRDVIDGTSNTIAVGGVIPAFEIPWTKPEDIPFTEDIGGPGAKGSFAAPYHIGGKQIALFGFADGSVQMIGEGVDTEMFHTLLAINDKQVVDRLALYGGDASKAVPIQVKVFDGADQHAEITGSL